MSKVFRVVDFFKNGVLLSLLWVIGTNIAWSNGIEYGGGYRAHPHSMWMDRWDNGHFIVPLMILVFVVFVAVFSVLFFVRSGKASSNNSSGKPNQRDPLSILQERYARGEIDNDEYEDRRRILEQGT